MLGTGCVNVKCDPENNVCKTMLNSYEIFLKCCSNILHSYLNICNIEVKASLRSMIPLTQGFTFWAQWKAKWRNILIASSGSCEYFPWALHQNSASCSFSKVSGNVNSEPLLMKFSYIVIIKSFHLFFTLKKKEKKRKVSGLP